MTAYAASNIHKEKVLQEHLIEQLVSTQGYVRRIGSEHSGGYDDNIHFDKAWAMDCKLVLRFVQNAQPDAWQKLNQHYPGSAEAVFFKQLDKALKDRGLLDVLRQGIKIVPGIAFTLCYFRPASGLEPKRMAEYEANILSVMDEVAYSQKHGNRLDIVLFLNGLPVVTIEAKNLLTGTTFKYAEQDHNDGFKPLSFRFLSVFSICTVTNLSIFWISARHGEAREAPIQSASSYTIFCLTFMGNYGQTNRMGVSPYST